MECTSDQVYANPTVATFQFQGRQDTGGFPATVTPDNLYDNHYRRNWWLMDAMLYLDFVKCEHEGARRIRDAMQGMHLPAPEFEQKEISGSVVRVTLRNNQDVRQRWVDTDASKIVGADLWEKLSEYEKRIINFAAEHNGQIKVSEAQRFMVKQRWGSAKKTLDKLVDLGVLKHVTRYPRDPTSYYVLTAQ